MSLVSVGDLAQSFLLRRQSAVLKSDVQHLSTEASTGQVSDTSARVSGDLVPISGLDASLARLKSYSTVATQAGLFAGAMQTVLGTVDGYAASLSLSLLGVNGGSAGTRIQDVAVQAHQSLDGALSALNTRVGDRTLFAGKQTSGAAISTSDSLLSALETATAGATSAADVEAAVTNWFNAPGGFASLGYQGGAPLASLSVAQGEEADLGITANDPALRDTIKGLAMAALLDRGILSGQPVAQADLAQRAGSALMQNQTDRTQLSARLGTVEAQIDKAATRNSAETSSLQIVRNNITSADPYETASKLQEAQGHLEAIYAITARMSRLSLLDYL